MGLLPCYFQAGEPRISRSGRHMHNFAQVIAFDWECGTLAYAFPRPGFAEVEAEAASGEVRGWRSQEASGCGRLRLDGLQPACAYQVRVRCGGQSASCELTTLPAPRGALLGEVWLVADPHVSLKPENRKGRFFVESAALLREVVLAANAASPDLVLLPGDITNHGTAAEYGLTREILSALRCRTMLLPGNHDYAGADGRRLWNEHFGDEEREVDLGYVLVAGIDTGSGELPAGEAERLQRLLAGSGRRPLLLGTHYQLYPSPCINHGKNAFAVANADEHVALLSALAARPNGMIYAGHQNIPALAVFSGVWQFNLPQPVQYPCGWVRARFYAEGVWHTFVPIASEILRQASRRDGDLAALFYEEPQWLGGYREGNCGLGNFMREWQE